MKLGQTQTEIAQILRRHKSIINRELVRRFVPRQAQNLSDERSQYCPNAALIFPEIWHSAKASLVLKWSPKQIVSQLPISHETIYQKIYAEKRWLVI